MSDNQTNSTENDFKIRIIKDTPFHVQGTLLLQEDFRRCYPVYAGFSLVETLEKNPHFLQWFKIEYPELVFGGKPVSIQFQHPGHPDVTIFCSGEQYWYTEMAEWLHHLANVFSTGFSTGKQFKGLHQPFNQTPETSITNTDFVTFGRMAIEFGCLTGTLQELRNILYACERLLRKDAGIRYYYFKTERSSMAVKT